MYIVSVEILENGEKTTYSDSLILVQDVLAYIDYFKNQENLIILDLEIKKVGV